MKHTHFDLRRLFFFLFVITTTLHAFAAITERPVGPNPDMQAVLDELATMKRRPIESLTPAEAREQSPLSDAVGRRMTKLGLPLTPEPVGKVADKTIPGPAGHLPIRVYWPQGNGPFPVTLYFHGGGWVLANLDTYDASARAITNAAGSIVISVQYRLAPENKYPAAVDDAMAAYQWTLANAQTLNGDTRRVAIAGESAGGNLAAVTAMRARDLGIAAPVHQLLIYPVVNFGFQSKSYVDHAAATPLNLSMMKWFWGHYLSNPEQGTHGYASPLQAKDLTRLPSATVILADIDPLRSEGQAYASALHHAGVRVRMTNYLGVTHEFFGMGAVLPSAKRAVDYAGRGLREAFGN